MEQAIMKRMILASASERRKELLERLIGKDIDICVSSYEEDYVDGISPVELVMYHSRQKALDVTKDIIEGLIISADTMIVCNGKILGKPADGIHAREMLHWISGQWLKAVTGLTVIDASSRKIITEHEVTDVRMRKMSEGIISDYIATGEPLGKAGAFAIQGKGSILVERIEGDFFNVVGLPLFRLSKILEGFDVDVLASDN